MCRLTVLVTKGRRAPRAVVTISFANFEYLLTYNDTVPSSINGWDCIFGEWTCSNVINCVLPFCWDRVLLIVGDGVVNSFSIEERAPDKLDFLPNGNWKASFLCWKTFWLRSPLSGPTDNELRLFVEFVKARLDPSRLRFLLRVTSALLIPRHRNSWPDSPDF